MEPTPSYKILSVEHYPAEGAIRTQFRVRVDEKISEEGLQKICKQIIADQEAPYNALAFLFYPPEANPDGPYIAGEGYWAPYGRWERAGEVEAGDYSQHVLKVSAGNAFGREPEPPATGLPEETHQEVFLAVVGEQDRGTGDQEAYRAVSSRFKDDP